MFIFFKWLSCLFGNGWYEIELIKEKAIEAYKLIRPESICQPEEDFSLQWKKCFSCRGALVVNVTLKVQEDESCDARTTFEDVQICPSCLVYFLPKDLKPLKQPAIF